MLINVPLRTVSLITQTFAFPGHLLVCKRLKTRVKYRSVSHFPSPHLQLPAKADVLLAGYALCAFRQSKS